LLLAAVPGDEVTVCPILVLSATPCALSELLQEVS